MHTLTVSISGALLAVNTVQVAGIPCSAHTAPGRNVAVSTLASRRYATHQIVLNAGYPATGKPRLWRLRALTTCPWRATILGAPDVVPV